MELSIERYPEALIKVLKYAGWKTIDEHKYVKTFDGDDLYSYIYDFESHDRKITHTIRWHLEEDGKPDKLFHIYYESFNTYFCMVFTDPIDKNNIGSFMHIVNKIINVIG